MKPFFIKCDFPNEKVAIRIFHNQQTSLLHTHSFDEIAIILKGSAVHEIGGNSYPLMRGDVFAVHGNQKHKISNTCHLTIANIIFEKDYFTEIKKKFKEVPGFNTLFLHEPQFREKQNFNAFLRLSASQLQYIEGLLMQMCEEQKARKTAFKPILESLFVQIIGILCRNYNKTDSPKTKGFLKISSAIDYMENHFAENLAIAQLSKISKMPETTFRRTFKKITGSSPIDYLIHVRIEKATELMREKPQLHVIDICMSSGFDNCGYFARKFKEIIGVTPIQYLRKQRR